MMFVTFLVCIFFSTIQARTLQIETQFVEQMNKGLLCDLVDFSRYSRDNYQSIELHYTKISQVLKTFKGEDLTKIEGYSAFYDIFKLNKESQHHKSYLLYKMLQGDVITAQVFRSLFPQRLKGVKEEEALLKVAEVTGGIEKSHQAFFWAYTFLKNNKVNLRFDCILHENVNVSSSRKKKVQTTDWMRIKYYAQPARPNEENWDGFEFVVEYIRPENSTCYMLPRVDEVGEPVVKFNFLVEDFKFNPQVPLQNCRIQVIGDKTNYESSLIPISTEMNNNIYNFTISVPNKPNELEACYNCHGWGIGLDEEISTYYDYTTNKYEDVKTIAHYKLWIAQLKKTYTTLEGIKPLDLFYQNLLKKLKPKSLLHSYTDDSYFDGRIIKIEGNDIETAENLCSVDGHIRNGALLIYSNGRMTHTARYIKSLGSWTSKLGKSRLVTHGNKDLNGTLYGRPAFLICPAVVLQTKLPDDTVFP